MNETAKELIAVVAQVSRKNAASINGDTSLNSLGMNSSLGLTIMRNVLEKKFGRKLPNLHWKMTVAEVGSMISAVEGAPAASSEVVPALEDFGVGVDIEDLSMFPVAADYQEDPFYKSNFSQAEIAASLTRPNPSDHLAGIFCAKEALKKADPAFLNLRMDEIVVTHTDGRPQIQTIHAGLNAGVRLKVSISHTTNVAMATVISLRVK